PFVCSLRSEQRKKYSQVSSLSPHPGPLPKGEGVYQPVANFSAFSVVPVFGSQSAGLKAMLYAILAVKTVRIDQSAGKGAKHHEKAFSNRARFCVRVCGKRVGRGARCCGAG